MNSASFSGNIKVAVGIIIEKNCREEAVMGRVKRQH